MMPVTITQGDSPVILGLPHGGTYVPDALMARLNDRGRRLSDTDWHIAQLYQGLLADVTTVEATFHRYVIDANRDPAGASLYPGANTTTLCPTTDFDGLDIWSEGQEPTLDEIAARRAHSIPRALSCGTCRRSRPLRVSLVKARHGVAIVFDCHSIRSTIPFLFPGLLPVFSIGTNDGQTCAPQVSQAVSVPCFASKAFDAGVEWPLQGRLDHAALWSARHGRSCHPDGTGPARLSRRRGSTLDLCPPDRRAIARGSWRKFYNPLTPLPARACSTHEGAFHA
jgi:N-formylglutamate deformylase